MVKTLDLSTVTLLRGSHNPDSQFCVMELAAYLAGEKWSDRPDCASPVITAFLVSWNDSLNDEDRQMLRPYAVKVIGTRTTPQDETTRAWMAADWLARTCAPAFLRLTPSLVKYADTLARLTALTDRAAAAKAAPALAAARAAARDAARAAARAAAWAAAWDAAWAAARAAAWDAAWAAARDAARDAARAAAWAKLTPTVKELQLSALDLLDRMIAVGRRDVPLAVTLKGYKGGNGR